MAAFYIELHAHSNFTFLDGASHPEDLVARAAGLGFPAMALTDRDGLYGTVRFHRAAADRGIRAILGSELTLASGHHLTVLVRSSRGYRNLCRLLTRARLSRPKGQAATTFEALASNADGLLLLTGCVRGEVPQALLRGDVPRAEEVLGRYQDAFGRANVFLEVQNHCLPAEARARRLLAELGARRKVPCVATNDVRYAVPEGRRLQDVLTCIRLKTPLEQAGTKLLPNGEYFLKSPGEMAVLFRDQPDALRQTLVVADRCDHDIGSLGYRFPVFEVPEGETIFSYLHRLAHEGARGRYRPLHAAAARQIAHELDVIEKLDLAGYFLIVWDIVRFCRERGILCQGRGSAANSAVCYALGITAVDPVGLDLLFERFLSEERTETPDIDLDIEHERREEVIQYVYRKYGREHAGMVCEVITFRARSAVRDVGKALGLSAAQVNRATNLIESHDASSFACGLESGREEAAGLKLESTRMRHLVRLCREIDGFPRHLSIHTGGMIVTAEPLDTVVPIENAAMPGRTVVQWDKDDVSAVGLIKIDLLGLGMLTLLSKAIALVREHEGIQIDLARLPQNDPRVYALLCRADTVGVFQVESRAQMNCLPRLKPRSFYDLVVEVALIRPGPIQGDMVHPYLKRRAGREPVTYPHPSLKPILERTLGVPLFQEQGMKLAVAAAGFTPAQADELRRAMGHKRSREAMARLVAALINGMRRNGIPAESADRILKQLTAFADYGFPESHAASFALLVYASAYLKVHHPLSFYTAILNSQPMGFYSPSTLVNDAKRHGIEVLPVDVRHSDWDCTIEGKRLRLGLRYVRGLGDEAKERIRVARVAGPFASPEDFARRTALSKPAIESLAGLGAFDGFGLSRREALWKLQALDLGAAGSLAASLPAEPRVRLPEQSAVEEAEADWWYSGMSVSHQPVALFREDLDRRGVTRAKDLGRMAEGRRVWVAGLVICRQHPPTAKGFTFLTLEDETGFSNVIVRPDLYEHHRAVLRVAPLLLVGGTLVKEDGVINVQGNRFVDLGDRSRVEGLTSHDFH